MLSLAKTRNPKFLLLSALRAAGLLRVADYGKYVVAQSRMRTLNRRFLQRHPDFAVPPEHLAFDALNHVDWQRYLDTGLQHAGMFARLIDQHASAAASLSVLEWGCGPGRLIRHMPQLLAGRTMQLTGADYNAESIAWCRAHLPGTRFVENALNPPLPLPDAGFDVVYNFSVFTHLSAAVQQAWVAELRRVLKPGGLFICTTHGDNYRHLLTAAAEQRAYDQGQQVEQGRYLEGRKWFLAIHPPAFVRSRLLAGFESVHQVTTRPEDGVLQDVWTARRPLADPAR